MLHTFRGIMGIEELTGTHDDPHPIINARRKAWVRRAGKYVLIPSPEPFQFEWVTVGDNCYLWWEIYGARPYPMGVEALLIRRSAGPCVVFCLN